MRCCLVASREDGRSFSRAEVEALVVFSGHVGSCMSWGGKKRISSKQQRKGANKTSRSLPRAMRFDFKNKNDIFNLKNEVHRVISSYDSL